MMDFILYMVPLFLALLIGDIVYSVWKKNGYYRFNDAINSLSMGLLSKIMGVYIRTLVKIPYFFVYSHFRFTPGGLDIQPDTWWKATLLFLAIDLCYYSGHRGAHKIHVLWGGHKTHHSSEDYNLSTALRQSAFEEALAWFFFLPLALFFDYTTFRFYFDINLVWQFWVHTRTIKKGPKWFEAIFVTPSHHRVHHASNPCYIDANFGGFLIIWDKMFGTFIEEKDDIEPVYGITDKIDYWNPVYGTVSHFIYLFNRLRRFPNEGIVAKLQVLFYGPGWSPKNKKYYPVRYVDAKTFVKYDPYYSPELIPYVTFQYFVTMVISLATFVLFPTPQWSLLPYTVILMFSLASIGKILEGAPSATVAQQWEYAKLIAVLIFGTIFLNGYYRIAAVAYSSISLVWLYLLRHAFEYKNQPVANTDKPATKAE